jgi:hypothetical protein
MPATVTRDYAASTDGLTSRDRDSCGELNPTRLESSPLNRDFSSAPPSEIGFADIVQNSVFSAAGYVQTLLHPVHSPVQDVHEENNTNSLPRSECPSGDYDLADHSPDAAAGEDSSADMDMSELRRSKQDIVKEEEMKN